jgi:hypothetical protein
MLKQHTLYRSILKLNTDWSALIAMANDLCVVVHTADSDTNMNVEKNRTIKILTFLAEKYS